MSQDDYQNEAIVEQETLKLLDNGFRRLTWARRQPNPSLLKRFLTRSLFRALKFRQTSSGVTLYDVAKSGFEHLDTKLGVAAYDAESYKAFKPLLHSIVCCINQVSPKTCHPAQSNWTDVDHINSHLIDPEGTSSFINVPLFFLRLPISFLVKHYDM